MLTYIIDGNNLIGKIPDLMRIQKKDKQASREKLYYLLQRYFSSRKSKVYLHFDGFESNPLRSGNIKIIYSENNSADDEIKNQVSSSKNRKNITVISSDSNVAEFAKVCSCRVISSDNFAVEIRKEEPNSEEEAKISSMQNIEEFKKLFGVKS